LDGFTGDNGIGWKEPSVQRRRRIEMEEVERLRGHWLERCEELSEAFVEDAARRGIPLDYSKTDLQALERFLRRERATVAVRISQKARRGLMLGASAYLGQVILRNMGGKLGWEASFQTVSVDDVGSQGIKALPWERVAELVDEGWGEPLKEYYERIEEAVEARARDDWRLNEVDVWGQIQDRIRSLREVGRHMLRDTGKLAASLLPLTYCPACRRLDGRDSAPLKPRPDQLRRGFPLLVRSTLSDARWDRCSHCGGQLLPLGYGFNTLGWHLLRSGEAGLRSALSGNVPAREEVYVTALNTTLQRSLFLRGLVHRAKKKITEIEVDELEDLKGGQFLVPLPSTPFYF